jgi:hypothetical protein
MSSETDAPGPRPGRPDLHHVGTSILYRAKHVLLALFVGGFLLLEWHIVKPEWVLEEGLPRQIALTVGVLLMAVTLYLLFDMFDTVEGVSKNVSRLLQKSVVGTHSLRDSTLDLYKELKSVKPDDKVVMFHLALNLVQSWDYIEKHFLKHPKLKNIELYLLMLPKDADQIVGGHPIPGDVRIWCTAVANSVKQIQSSLEALQPEMEQAGKKVLVLIKHYRVVPVVHGYSVEGRSRHHYVSFCRWKSRVGKPPEDWPYDWGEDTYHKVVSEAGDLALGDLANVFDGHFAFLWRTSGDLAVNFSCLREPVSDDDQWPVAHLTRIRRGA